MDNLMSPAAPFVNHLVDSYEDRDLHYGFTKLEKAALMLASGGISDGTLPTDNKPYAIAIIALAKAVLEEANK